MPRMKSRVRKIVFSTLATGGSHRVLEQRTQPVIAVEEMLRDDARLADHRHKIRVPVPAWDHVPVQMVLDAGARRAAEIHPQIETSRPIDSLKDVDRPSHRLGEVLIFFSGQG